MKHSGFHACALALTLALFGCASTPEASRSRDAEAKEFDVQPGAATVYVYRSPLNTDTDDNVLYVDNRLIGSTVPGTYFRIFLTPGKHTLHGIGFDLGKLTFDARPGELYFVDLAVIIGHSNYQLVPPPQGRLAVEQCCVLLENWAPGQRPLLR